MHKAEQLESLAIDNGWQTHLDIDNVDELQPHNYNEITWTVYAKRGRETIKVVWRGNKQEEAAYTFNGNRRILWWKSEVVRYLTANPKDDREIPWNQDSPALDIMRAVVNRTIKWTRAIDGAEMESTVDVDLREEGSAKHFRVYETKSGGRVVEWADRYGFHAINLKQIVTVS